MIVSLMIVVVLASGVTSQAGEPVDCDIAHLDSCDKHAPLIGVGLPTNRAELDKRCRSWSLNSSVWRRASPRVSAAAAGLPAPGRLPARAAPGLRRLQPAPLAAPLAAPRAPLAATYVNYNPAPEMVYHMLRTYQIGTACLDAYIKQCRPTALPGRALMHFLCDNKKAYLKESSCWARLSPAWAACMDELLVAMRTIKDRSYRHAHFYDTERCCAHNKFQYCVYDAGHHCSISSNILLQRMARMLAKDVGDCAPQARCSAPPHHSPPAPANILLALLLATVIYVVI